jgi:nitrogen fixation-related uncharacterized protein
MNDMTFSSNALLIFWITFAAVYLGSAVAVLVWAVRARQFSDQDRARYLPLRSGIPRTENQTTDGPGAALKSRAGVEQIG